MMGADRGERHIPGQDKFMLALPVGERGELPRRGAEQFRQPGDHPARRPHGSLAAVGDAQRRQQRRRSPYGRLHVDTGRHSDHVHGCRASS